MIADNLTNTALDEILPIYQFLKYEYLIFDLPKSELPILNEPMKAVSRLVLSESSIPMKEIKKKLQTLRHKYDLIEVEPRSAGLASFAVQDNRVDLIKLNTKMGLKIINAKYGNRLVSEGKILTFDLSFMRNRQVARDLRPYLRYFSSFGSRFIPIYLQQQVADPHELRSYRGLQAIARLLGLSNKQTSPDTLVERIQRNYKKLSGKIPFDGVETLGS